MTIGPDADQLREERTALVLDQWPHLNRALGCDNCLLLFAEATNGRCPGCGSDVAVFDAAALLNSERPAKAEVIAQVRAMLDRLEKGIGDV